MLGEATKRLPSHSSRGYDITVSCEALKVTWPEKTTGLKTAMRTRTGGEGRWHVPNRDRTIVLYYDLQIKNEDEGVRWELSWAGTAYISHLTRNSHNCKRSKTENRESGLHDEQEGWRGQDLCGRPVEHCGTFISKWNTARTMNSLLDPTTSAHILGLASPHGHP